MSGHSKWAQIKRQKGATDAKKGQVFAKMAKAISVAARKGSDPASNFELRAIIEKAKAVNMPADNIKRAIEKGSGKNGETLLENVRYEAYGPGGIAIIVECVTDNTNRTTAEIKHLLLLSGGKWGETGSVTWAFERINPSADFPSGGWKPKQTVKTSEEDGQKLANLLEKLEDQEDAQEVFHNAE